MLSKTTSYKIFRILWIYLLVISIADLRLHTSIDIIPFLHISEIPFIKYLPFILAAILLIPFKDYLKTVRKSGNIVILSIILCILVIAVISSYYSEYPETAFKLCTRYFFYFLILVALLTAVEYYENAGSFLIRSFIYVNILVITGSLLDYYFPSFHLLLIQYFDRPEAKHSVLNIGNEVYMRPMGFITDSNLTALSIGLALILLLLNQKHFGRIFTYFFFAAAAYSMGMLASRAALVMVSAAAVIFFVIRATNRKQIVLFVVILIVFQSITPQFYARYLAIGDEEKIETEVKFGRPVIWKAAIDQFKESPLIGNGPGNFFEHSQNRIRAVIFRENPGINIDDPNSKDHYEVGKGNPHSIFLAVLCELGILGFVLFLLLLLYMLYNFIKKRKLNSLIFMILIISVSAISNFAPYFKHYLLVCVIFYVLSEVDMKIQVKSTP